MIQSAQAELTRQARSFLHARNRAWLSLFGTLLSALFALMVGSYIWARHQIGQSVSAGWDVVLVLLVVVFAIYLPFCVKACSRMWNR